MLAFGGAPAARPHLIDVGLWLGGEKGLVTYRRLMPGLARDRQEKRRLTQDTTADQRNRTCPNLLSRVEVCANLCDGVRNVAPSDGLAGFESNAVVMGGGHPLERAHDYGNLIFDLTRLDRSVVLVAWDEDRGFGRKQRIDLWWGGLDSNGGLMLLLAYLLASTPDWRAAELRVKMILPDVRRRARTEEQLKPIIEPARLKAVPEVIVNPEDGRSIAEISGPHSTRADLVLLGMRPPEPDKGAEFVSRVNALVDRLPTVLLIRASEEFEGARMMFEEDKNPVFAREEAREAARQERARAEAEPEAVPKASAPEQAPEAPASKKPDRPDDFD